MARKTKAAATPEIVADEDLLVAALLNISTLKASVADTELKLSEAIVTNENLRAEVSRLKPASAPVTTIVGVAALAECLGYPASYLASVISGLRAQGLPCKIEEGTYVFNLPDVHTWFVDRREVTTTEALKLDFNRLSLTHLGNALRKNPDQIDAMIRDGLPTSGTDDRTVVLPNAIDWMIRCTRREVQKNCSIESSTLDAVIDALNLVVTQTDAVMDSCGDDWLDDPDTATEVARLSNLQRHLRTAIDDLEGLVS